MSDGGNFPSESEVVKYTEPIPWRGFRAFDKVVFVLLPLVAVVVAVLPLLDDLLFRRAARLLGNRALVAWLASGGAWIVAGGILVLLAVYVLWRRQQLVGNRALWSSSGCPACGERELVRVSRHFSDRFYRLAAVPAYRYACRNCTWRGLRIGRREHSLVREAELEAALLRFDPDAHADAAALPLAAATQGEPRHLSSIFRDAGDVAWDEPGEPPGYANGTTHPDDGSAEDMDWIWGRPSGTDQI
mgnify:CR=1 FL=1